MVTPTQKTLVQNTFAAIVPIADDAASLFYRRLFENDPSLRAMFRGDMAEQRWKLIIEVPGIASGGAAAVRFGGDVLDVPDAYDAVFAGGHQSCAVGAEGEIQPRLPATERGQHSLREPRTLEP
jgi:hypothetical protein